MTDLQESVDVETDKTGDIKTEDVQFYDAFDAINKYFNYCGLCDLHKKTFSKSNRYQQFQRFVYILGMANIIPLICGELTFLVLSFLTDEDNFLETADMLPCLIMSILGCAKTLNLIAKRYEVYTLVEDLQKMWPKSENSKVKKIVRENMTFTKNFCTFYMHLTVGLAMTYHLLPIMEIAYNCILDRFFSGGSKWNDYISMPYVIWYPYDWRPFLLYIPTYMSQFYGGLFITSSVSSTDCFFCLLVAQVCMHFQLLHREIEDLNIDVLDQTKAEADSGIDEDLKRIVEYHNFLYEFSDRIEQLFSVTLFFNFASSSLLICLEIFCVTIAPRTLAFKYAMFFVSSVSQILLMCFYGDKLVEESDKVADAAYNSNWADGNSSLRHGVLMLMCRARKPAIISAMSFTTASLETFSSIMSASWSYFTLLHNVYEGAVDS